MGTTDETPPLPGKGGSFQARRFGPGLPPQGETTSVQAEADRLVLNPGAPDETSVPYEALQVTAGGFHGDQILLSWTEGEETRSLILSDPAAKGIFLAAAPPVLSPQLARWKKEVSRVQRGLPIGALLIGLVLLLPLLLGVALWWKSDAIAEWAVRRVSHETEVRLGDAIFEQSRIGLKLLPSDAATKMVTEIGERLTKGTPYRFHWHVADDPTVNAFAIPGGHVVVFTGLIKAADSAEEVAGVLAHEVQHILLRHSLKGMVHQIGWRMVVDLLVGEWGGGAISEAAAQLQVLKFGRDQESQADLKGLVLLKEARIDPNGMITFFDRLAKQEGVVIPLLSTHPGSGNRTEALRSEITRLGPWKSEPLPYELAVLFQ